MALLRRKKINRRRQRVRNSIATERFTRLASVVNSPYPKAIVVLLIFILVTTALLGLQVRPDRMQNGLRSLKSWPQLISLLAIVSTISIGMSLYLLHYQPRILNRTTRLIALAVLFWILLAISHVFSFDDNWKPLAVGTGVACGIVLTISYDQRFAIGMVMFYIMLAAFALDQIASVQLVMVMAVGTLSCCFSLREIRTRKKLIEVSLLATILVFITSTALGIIRGDQTPQTYFLQAGIAAAATFVVGIFIQAFLPIIEQAFGIATSMTLMDYSDANQPLLRKLAMDAPGTFSHSLLIGSISEVAAESIGANGLLCRVGAYYHDIGKIHKPAYFIENQMGSVSRHEQLSPAMSQLVIAGHVKDGMEIAKEFGLPVVLRQFIETHHGTTLIEYFYHEAKKQQDDKQGPVSDSEFRYPGPKPKSKEAAIVMLADAAESACRSLTDHTPAKVETLVHTLAMKRLQDGQFDECDLTLRELSRIEESLSKSLAAHHHGRIAYPKDEKTSPANGNGRHNHNVTAPKQSDAKQDQTDQEPSL